MSENSFNLNQKTFPGVYKKVEVDLESLKIKVHDKNLFKQRIYSVDLYEMNENPLRISKKPMGWFLLALFLSLCTFFGSFLLFLSGLPIVVLVLMSLCCLTGSFLCWNKYLEEYTALIYVSKYHTPEYELLRLIIQNTTEYQSFVARLEETLINLRKGKDLRVMIEQTPRKILLEEFRASYIEELIKRDVDVLHILENLQEYFSIERSLIPNKYLH